MKKSICENISDMFDLPKDTLINMPRIMLTGDKEIYVENYKGILEYSDEVIRLNINGRELKICGGKMDIREIGESDITLSGTIKSVEFA